MGVNMKKLKVGFVAGFMEGFSEEKLNMFSTYQKKLEKLSGDLNFELITLKDIVITVPQAIKARQDLEENQVDFVLLFHPSYLHGDLVYEILKVDAPVGLWAIEELRDSGPMPLASMVSLEQNCSMAVHNFTGKPKKFKWFFGDMDGKYFKDRFTITMKVLGTVKNLKNARIGQIGKLADGHINHMVNEREIYSNLGVDVFRDYEIEDVLKLAEEVPQDEVEKEMKYLKGSCAIVDVAEEKVVDSVKMALAVKNICLKEDYAAVAFSCWPKLMPGKEMVGCLVNSRLNSAGIASGCEADVLSTISMLILRYLTDEIVAVMDLSRFDDNDDSLMLWHCGSAPIEMANDKGTTLKKHYFAEYAESLANCGPITDVTFKKGDVTVFRLVKESGHFYYFTGKFFDEEKASFDGSRGWVNDLKLYGEPIGSMDLANTLLTNGLPHHFPMVMKNTGKYLEEFAYWMGLKKIRRLDYKDYLYV
jgi:L-fucose isomerase-like protein